MSGDTLINILQRLIDADQGNLPPNVANAILSLQFADGDQKRVAELGAKSTSGTLSSEESAEYDSYIAAGDFLSLWKAKARLSLKQHSSAA